MNENKCHDTTCECWRAQLCQLIKGELPWKWAISIVLSSPKSLRKNKVEPGDWTIFLVLEDKTFTWGYFWYFDLISNSNRDWEYNFDTGYFLSTFECNDDILTELIFNFHNGRIEWDYIRTIELWFILLEYFKDMVLHLENHSHHALFDFKSINGVISLITVEFEQLHAAIVIY